MLREMRSNNFNLTLAQSKSIEFLIFLEMYKGMTHITITMLEQISSIIGDSISTTNHSITPLVIFRYQRRRKLLDT